MFHFASLYEQRPLKKKKITQRTKERKDSWTCAGLTAGVGGWAQASAMLPPKAGSGLRASPLRCKAALDRPPVGAVAPSAGPTENCSGKPSSLVLPGVPALKGCWLLRAPTCRFRADSLGCREWRAGSLRRWQGVAEPRGSAWLADPWLHGRRPRSGHSSEVAPLGFCLFLPPHCLSFARPWLPFKISSQLEKLQNAMFVRVILR